MRPSMSVTRVYAPTRAHIARRKRSGHRARISNEIQCKVGNTRRQAHARVQLIDTLLSCCSVPDAECSPCGVLCCLLHHASSHQPPLRLLVSGRQLRHTARSRQPRDAMLHPRAGIALPGLPSRRRDRPARKQAGCWLAKSLTGDKSAVINRTQRGGVTESDHGGT